MRGPHFRTLASQITVLTAVPLTIVLLAVAALALYSNQRTRLDGYLHGDAQIAILLARPAQEAMEMAASAGPIDFSTRGPEWQSLIRSFLAEPAGMDLALIDPAGLIAYHSAPERIRSENGAAERGSGDSPASIGGSRVRRSPDMPTAIVATARIGESDWAVATERSWNPWIEAVSGFGVLVVIPVFVAALLPVLLIGLSTMRITQPIRQLLAHARRISAGDFRPAPAIARTGDEVEELAVQFDEMAKQLRSLYGSLERRVDDRTSELLSVLNLARAVGQSFDPTEIAQITCDQLRAHPRVIDAQIWVENRSAEWLGLPLESPEWVVEEKDAHRSQANLDLKEGSDPDRSSAKNVHVLELRARDASARLGVVTDETYSDADITRFTEAVAAQAGVALQNAVLYRRAQAVAATEERNRLAREIHDTLAQSITGVILQLEALRAVDGSERGQRLDRAMDLARSGLREARRSVQGLRASILDSKPLDQAIAAEVERLAEGNDLRARFGSSGDVELIPSNVASELFRIVDEAITNVQRHARASNVLVNLLVDSGAIRLVIEDDGVGFNAGAQNSHGHGLAGIRERAMNIGGELVLETEPGEGTRVQVVVTDLPGIDRDYGGST